MRKVQTAAVVAAMIGTIGFVGAGTASAHDGGPGVTVGQSTQCKSHDLNLDVLGEVGVLNGALGNVLGGEGNPGGQASSLGSSMGCSNSAF
jgi:hypothetical protein